MPAQQGDFMRRLIVLPANLTTDSLRFVFVFLTDGPFIAGPATTSNLNVTLPPFLQSFAQHP